MKDCVPDRFNWVKPPGWVWGGPDGDRGPALVEYQPKIFSLTQLEVLNKIMRIKIETKERNSSCKQISELFINKIFLGIWIIDFLTVGLYNV